QVAPQRRRPSRAHEDGTCGAAPGVIQGRGPGAGGTSGSPPHRPPETPVPRPGPRGPDPGTGHAGSGEDTAACGRYIHHRAPEVRALRSSVASLCGPPSRPNRGGHGGRPDLRSGGRPAGGHLERRDDGRLGPAPGHLPGPGLLPDRERGRRGESRRVRHQLQASRDHRMGVSFRQTRILEVVLKRTDLAASLLSLFMFAASQAHAAALSPRIVAAARGTADEAKMNANAKRYEMSRAWGVDKIHPAFNLNLAKYPRGGVAHRNILVVLCDFDADNFGGA